MAAPLVYELIATDLDGTLLRGDDTFSDRSRAALARVVSAGAHHLVVTGRPAPRVRPLLDELGGRGLAVCGQGAQVYDSGADRLLFSVTLDRELAETALGKIEAEVGQVYAAVDQDGVDGLTLIEPGYLMPHPFLPAVRVERRDDLWCEPISKVLLRHHTLTDDELATAARGAVGSLATVTMSGPGTVELQPCGITKATGLALAAEFLGLSRSRTIAFGDMPNDIPMFHWAARGVAMANAHPELKAVADEITTSNEDDGIAVVLERLFAENCVGKPQ
ncbi:HAD family hydrolase [Streptomyces sp. NPDC047022]|uniref:HAD family hydrolase n=1 Tax=Streptomyces sp. NPDC047022 TaxID=3155737 RepID=UPI0033F596FB